MSETKSTVNTFQKGMHTGLDKSQDPKQVYTDSFNGRVIYNEDGNYAWENAKGTKQALTIAINHGGIYPPVPGSGLNPPPYILIGQCTINGQCVVLLTNNWWSEIGVISQPQYGVFQYNTIYNDYNDPYGPFTTGANVGQGRLQLKTSHNAEMWGIVENLMTTRVYWDDDFNESRTLNIIPPLVQTTPPPVGQQIWTIPYPVWHSAHGISSMPDLTWGLMKYQQNVTGSLVAGKRQYCYRMLHQSGYASPWSPLTAQIFCTGAGKVVGDWTQYVSTAAGTPTDVGHQLELKYLDTRFQEVQIAALYWATDLAPQGGLIVYKGNVPPSGQSLIFQHTGDVGEVLTEAQINQIYFEISAAKTGSITGDNFFHQGNIQLYPEPQIDPDIVANITASPILKKMISDETGLVTQIPLTNQTLKTAGTTRNIFSGASGSFQEQYLIVNDYCNYKGTQWEHLYKSYIRDDTYPFAVVLFDRKGQPSWAQHITDFHFPSQAGNTFTDTRLSGITTGTQGAVGDYRLTDFSPNSTDVILDDTGTGAILQGNNVCPIIQGIVFGGIDLTDILYDENGELQISGMAIVAMPRLGSIIAQGLLLNTDVNRDDNGNDTHDTRPMGSAFNWIEQIPNFGQYTPYIGCNDVYQAFGVRSNSFTFEAPDGFINPNIFGQSLGGDTIELIGAVAPVNLAAQIEPFQGFLPTVEGTQFFLGYSPNDMQQFMAGYATAFGGPSFHLACNQTKYYFSQTNYWPHYYNKNYIALFNQDVDSDPTTTPGVINSPLNGRFGSSWDVTKLFVQARAIPAYDTVNNWAEVSGMSYYYPVIEEGTGTPQFNYGIYCSKNYTAIAHMDTILLYSDNLTTASLRYHDPAGTGYTNRTSYYVANYKANIAAPQISQSLLDNRVYNNIGHFIPINAQTLALAYDATTQKYIFNDIEVYYGDTYVDFFVYDRLVPAYFTLPGEPTDSAPPTLTNWYDMPDYAVGCGFPVETAYNHTMRNGTTYPRYGSEPESTYQNKAGENPLGIFYYSDSFQQPENFDVFAYMNAADTANQYNSLVECFGQPLNTDFPLMEAYSNQKIDGECYDSFRMFPTSNFQYAQGQYGEITSMSYMGGYSSIYLLQKYAFARILFNERAEVAATGGSLTTATAGGYQGHNYISIEDGCQHQWSVVNTGKALSWTDAEKGRLNIYRQNGVECYSNAFDYHDQITYWTRSYWEVVDPSGVLVDYTGRYYDNPAYLGGIVSVYDYKNESIYTTFTTRLQSDSEGTITSVGTPNTVEFSEKLSQFQTRHGFYPSLYFNLKQSFFSAAPFSSNNYAPIIFQHDEGIRGQIYGVNQPSTLMFTTNPEITRANYFDNGEIGVETSIGATKINSVNLVTPITGAQTIILNNTVLDNRPLYQEGFLRYPMRDITNPARMVGKYLTQEYEIGNDGSDVVVRITDVLTKYRESNRP